MSASAMVPLRCLCGNAVLRPRLEHEHGAREVVMSLCPECDSGGSFEETFYTDERIASTLDWSRNRDDPRSALSPLRSPGSGSSSEVVMTGQADLIAQLCDLTKRWNEYEDVPDSQQSECRSIGRKLNELGGCDLMQEAYYEAKGSNRAASVIAAYWDNIGDWRW